jgi:hypothetical protein
MINKCVEIDFRKHLNNEMPKWAVSYLNRDNLLDYLEIMKVSRRGEGLHRVCELNGLMHLLKRINCNEKGDLIFSWDTEAEMNKFIKKWSNR